MPEYAVEGEWLVELVNEHTCGAGDNGQHEPSCGMEPIAKIDDLLRASAESDLHDEWGHRYHDGSIIADSSEVVAKSRALMSKIGSGHTLELMVRRITDWEPADVDCVRREPGQ